MIFQLGPVSLDIGGRYTTGICNVVKELDIQLSGALSNYKLLATNISTRLFFDNRSVYRIDLLLKSLPVLVFLLFIRLSKFNFLSGFYGRIGALKLFYYSAVLLLLKSRKVLIHGIYYYWVSEILNFTDKKFLVVFHGYFEGKLGFESQLDDIRFNSNVRFSFLTDRMRDQFVNRNEFIDGVVISNGVDKGFWKRCDDLMESRSSIRFITVASVQSRKGQLWFYENCLKELEIDWEYIIVGGLAHDNSSEYDGFFADSRIKYLGLISDRSAIREAYCSADIYAHVSTAEGQALSVLEASSLGLPIIVRDLIIDTLGDLEWYNILNVLDSSNPKLELTKSNVDRIVEPKVRGWDDVSSEYIALLNQL